MDGVVACGECRPIGRSVGGRSVGRSVGRRSDGRSVGRRPALAMRFARRSLDAARSYHVPAKAAPGTILQPGALQANRDAGPARFGRWRVKHRAPGSLKFLHAASRSRNRSGSLNLRLNHSQSHSHSQSQSQSLTQRKNLMVSNSARSGAVPLPKARCQTWSFSVVGESITTTAALTFHHANQRPGCAANTTASYTACAPRAHITSGRRPASRT